MTDLLYRHQQILTALHDSIDGLTNKEIIQHCKKMRPNEVPDDITQMGLNTQALRRRELVTTDDTASGKIHRITDKGREILAEARGEPSPQAKPPAAEPGAAQDLPVKTYPLSAIEEPKLPDDMLEQFDQAVGIIREGIVAALNLSSEPVRIAIKQQKITLLEQLENTPFFSGPDRELIAAIRADLDQFDAA
jgi:DNA-binding PadR family transcriptional regulator